MAKIVINGKEYVSKDILIADGKVFVDGTLVETSGNVLNVTVTGDLQELFIKENLHPVNVSVGGSIHNLNADTVQL